MNTLNRMLQSTAIQCNVDHIATGFFHRLLNRCWNFTRFTVTKTYATVAITHYSQCGEAENTATLNGFRYAIYRDQLFLQFSSLFFRCETSYTPTLELKASFAGSICQRLDSTMILETRTVKRHLRDLFRQRALCNSFTH
ncbi:Uncharacterised protein [Leminorella grimontii]|nr:Uncharacterised protein [Leminorella grimontii]